MMLALTTLHTASEAACHTVVPVACADCVHHVHHAGHLSAATHAACDCLVCQSLVAKFLCPDPLVLPPPVLVACAAQQPVGIGGCDGVVGTQQARAPPAGS
jgi:hypothetical protein